MPVKTYNPDDTYTAGNTAVVLCPSVANIAAPTVAEIEAGYAIQCAIESIELSSDVDTQSRKKLCDTVATQSPGEMTYTTADTEIVASDPQQKNNILELCAPGSIVYMIVRPGVKHNAAFAANQRVWVNRQQVTAYDAGDVTTDTGDAFSWVIHWATKAREYNAVVKA